MRGSKVSLPRKPRKTSDHRPRIFDAYGQVIHVNSEQRDAIEAALLADEKKFTERLVKTICPNAVSVTWHNSEGYSKYIDFKRPEKPSPPRGNATMTLGERVRITGKQNKDRR